MVFNGRFVPVFMLQMTHISGPSMYYCKHEIKNVYVAVKNEKLQQNKYLHEL